MRSLYWKIFLSFWLASTLIIVSTAWVTSELALKSAIPAREKVFMDSYANAAVTTYESGHAPALKKWLKHAGNVHNMTLYLLTHSGQLIGNKPAPPEIRQIAHDHLHDTLNEGLLTFGNIIISHEILSTSGGAYRLAAISNTPLSHFIQITWEGLTIRLLIAVFFSGLMCYLLSIYLTKPLRSLSLAAKSIATGQLNTRVGQFKGHYRDEIAELSHEFDRMAETIEEMIQSKERLLQDISHELRSPLARLQIAIELGRTKSNNMAIQEFSRMEEECIRLNSLIGEILDYARLNQALYPLKRTKVDVPKLIQHIVDDANFEFGQTKTRVQLKTINKCNLLVDEPLIHRAIENILRNALRYSPNKALVKIDVSLNSAKDNLIIEIIDKGPGIPEDQIEKIFNPFYRVDTSRTKKTGGFGLGLSIAQQALQLHHGNIHIQNQKPHGLSVRLSIPTQ